MLGAVEFIDNISTLYNDQKDPMKLILAPQPETFPTHWKRSSITNRDLWKGELSDAPFLRIAASPYAGLISQGMIFEVAIVKYTGTVHNGTRYYYAAQLKRHITPPLRGNSNFINAGCVVLQGPADNRHEMQIYYYDTTLGIRYFIRDILDYLEEGKAPSIFHDTMQDIVPEILGYNPNDVKFVRYT